jgi:hypothetical protein
MMPALDLEELLARNRALFGDARMEAADDEDKDGDGSGDDGDKPEGDAADAADKEAEEKAAADALGDPGKQALDRMKERVKKATARATAAEKALADSKKPAEGDDKPDLDAIREQARTEARTEQMRDRVMDKIEAKAGGKFGIDTEDVAALLMRRHELDDFLDDGKIDVEAITEALNDLLEKQPRLAAGVTQGDEKKFKGGGDGGARGKASKSQLTEADVKKLAADGKHAEIEQARVDGRLNELLGIK